VRDELLASVEARLEVFSAEVRRQETRQSLLIEDGMSDLRSEMGTVRDEVR
jgi:hypothetical protein